MQDAASGAEAQVTISGSVADSDMQASSGEGLVATPVRAMFNKVVEATLQVI